MFTVLISNSDNHLRNHAFLYTGPDGWRLSPAYDLNPVPTKLKSRILATAIDTGDNLASLDLAMSVAEYFELNLKVARSIAAEVGTVVKTWREEAVRFGIAKSEFDSMATAFEH